MLSTCLIEDLCDLYSNAEVPHIAYFNNNHARSQRCTEEISKHLTATYSLPETWHELVSAIELGGRIIAFHVKMLALINISATEFIDAILTISRFMPQPCHLKIGVVISADTPLSIVKELKKTGVHGVLLDLNDYHILEAAKAIKSLVTGDKYWPKEILNKLPGSPKKNAASKVVLTPRQLQILNLIKDRGLSNRSIAKTLGISESTVKVHITEIFKRYGVRTRTQLAVFSLPK